MAKDTTDERHIHAHQEGTPVTPATHDREDDNAVFNIGTAARRSGLSVTTIRTWEDRYGAVVPARDDSGRRLYSNHQIAQLTWLRRQVEGGLQAAEAHRLLDLNPVAPDDGEAPSGAAIDGAPWMAAASWVEGERAWLESMLEDLARGLGAEAAGVGSIVANQLYGDVLIVMVRALLADDDPLTAMAAMSLRDHPALADAMRAGGVVTLTGEDAGVPVGALVVAPFSVTGTVAGAVVIAGPTRGDAESITGQAAKVIEARIDADRARSAFARLLG